LIVSPFAPIIATVSAIIPSYIFVSYIVSLLQNGALASIWHVANKMLALLLIVHIAFISNSAVKSKKGRCKINAPAFAWFMQLKTLKLLY
jgi:hypothetical protein